MKSWLKAEDGHLYVPKLFVALREGYSWDDFRADLFAGLTVAIVALPLSMALAIASGVAPERGLFTAVVAGFLISALGGSRRQIGGPAGVFVVVVFNVVDQFGYDGLVLATVMAGGMLIRPGCCAPALSSNMSPLFRCVPRRSNSVTGRAISECNSWLEGAGNQRDALARGPSSAKASPYALRASLSCGHRSGDPTSPRLRRAGRTEGPRRAAESKNMTRRSADGDDMGYWEAR